MTGGLWTVRRKCLEKMAGQVHLSQCDFFTVDPLSSQPVDIVLGNPPYIRYQKFDEESRCRALASAARTGAELTRLTSTWAPFLLHAMQFLAPGGVMAFVVPAEIVQTNYGVPTLNAIVRSFEDVRLVAFARNFFPGAQTETFLLLASGYGGKARSCVQLYAFDSIDELNRNVLPVCSDLAPLEIKEDEILHFAEAFLLPDERRVWRDVLALPSIGTVSDYGEITNGYVTGDNTFFHRCKAEAQEAGIPAGWLHVTARNAHSLRGLEFTRADVAELEAQSLPHHLLTLPNDDLFAGDHKKLYSLIEEGKARGVDRRFKCRSRSPWWRVPGTHIPDVLVPYMIGRNPVFCVNSAKAVYSNTLHGIRTTVDPFSFSFALYSTLSLLSMEIQGRSYGGGILKLEPREFSRVHLVLPAEKELPIKEFDTLLRTQRFEAAGKMADQFVLRETLGLGEIDIRLLQSARERLVARRNARSQRRKGETAQ